MNSQTFSMIYAAVLHVCALVGLVVLVASGKVSWAEGGPILCGLVGLGAAVPLVLNGTSSPGAAQSPPQPEAPAPVVVADMPKVVTPPV